jgi:DNA-binding transcriptional MerR regulator
MPARLTIGDFSRMSHLSVKTLRRYHEAGLLEPAEVDEWTGYRYYDPAQIPTAQAIRRFRDLGLPVREIHDLLTTPDGDRRRALLGRHLGRLEEQLAQTRDAVTALRRLLAADPGELVVERRTTPARRVAAVRSPRVEHDDVLTWYSEAMEELHAVLARSRLTPTGPAGGLYANELYTQEAGEMVVYLPVDDPPLAGRVAPYQLPEADLATVVHDGPHTDIDVTYGRLGRWVAEHGLGIAGPVHEICLVGPRDTARTEQWRTEIGWPVTAGA